MTAVLDFGKIAISSPEIEGFGSNFVCWYNATPLIGSRDQKCHPTKGQDGGGRHIGFHQCHFYVVDGRILIKFGTLMQNDTM